MATKVYAVLLLDGAGEELGKFFSLFIKERNGQAYIYATSIDPNGAYFHMKIERSNPSGHDDIMELQLPHRYIKGVLYAADMKQLGFV